MQPVAEVPAAAKVALVAVEPAPSSTRLTTVLGLASLTALPASCDSTPGRRQCDGSSSATVAPARDSGSSLSPTTSVAADPVPDSGGPKIRGYRLEDGPGRFSVTFPGSAAMPAKTVDHIASPLGKIEVASYVTQDPAGIYYVSRNAYPALGLCRNR